LNSYQAPFLIPVVFSGSLKTCLQAAFTGYPSECPQQCSSLEQRSVRPQHRVLAGSPFPVLMLGTEISFSIGLPQSVQANALFSESIGTRNSDVFPQFLH
jgi:hypothetical protein